MHTKAIQALVGSRRRLGALYVGGAGGLGLWYQVAIAAVARALGYRITFHHHAWSYLSKPFLSARLLNLVVGAAGEHVFLTSGMKVQFDRRYRTRGRANVISNLAFHTSATTPPARPRVTQGPLVVGHLSNLCADKGIDLVVSAVRAVRATGVDLHLRLAGPACDEAARSALAQLSVDGAEWFRYEGRVDPADVTEFMLGLDLFLFPSTYRNEAEPLVVIEALAAGTAVLATDVGGLPELLNGLGAVSPAAEFSSALMDLIREPERLQALQQVARSGEFAARSAHAAASLTDMAHRLTTQEMS